MLFVVYQSLHATHNLLNGTTNNNPDIALQHLPFAHRSIFDAESRWEVSWVLDGKGQKRGQTCKMCWSSSWCDDVTLIFPVLTGFLHFLFNHPNWFVAFWRDNIVRNAGSWRVGHPVPPSPWYSWWFGHPRWLGWLGWCGEDWIFFCEGCSGYHCCVSMVSVQKTPNSFWVKEFWQGTPCFFLFGMKMFLSLITSDVSFLETPN